MINLLPENEKKAISKEYRLRIVAVCLFLLLLTNVAAAVLLTPSFMSSASKKAAANQKIASYKTSETEQHKELVQELDDLKLSAAVLAPDAATTTPTDLVLAVIQSKTADNVISAIQYSKSMDDKLEATVTGVAASRESLVTFTDNLKKEPGIAAVDLPVGDLARDSNIPFTVDITGT